MPVLQYNTGTSNKIRRLPPSDLFLPINEKIYNFVYLVLTRSFANESILLDLISSSILLMKSSTLKVPI